MYSVYQHWDPLKVCVVGRSYPPEFYSWITVSHVRNLFERIAQETEEDFQRIIQCLKKFGVSVVRPNLPQPHRVNGRFIPPPMTPRDHSVMIGKNFYMAAESCTGSFYHGCYDHIVDQIYSQGNTVKIIGHGINGAMVSRLGRDLYFGTQSYDQHCDTLRRAIDHEFGSTRNHVVNTGGHSDATYCPVCPGLIISLYDVPTYQQTFPGWEVVYLPSQSWSLIPEWQALKNRNRGRWWIPGFEHDAAVIETVETWLSHWTGYVEQTVFDVNMLVIDPKNVMVFNHNNTVFEALQRYGITPHVVPFRHRYFWDGGIHCVTLDLDRSGVMQDFFPERN